MALGGLPITFAATEKIEAALNLHTFRRFANPRALLNSRHFSTMFYERCQNLRTLRAKVEERGDSLRIPIRSLLNSMWLDTHNSDKL